MNIAIVWLLIAIGGGNSAPNTLAVLNDDATCRVAAQQLQELSGVRRGSPFIYAYCIPVQAKTLVK